MTKLVQYILSHSFSVQAEKNPVTNSQGVEFLGVCGRGNVGLSLHLEMV